MSDLSLKASTASVESALALKQNTIADNQLPQAKITNLVSDLSLKASTASVESALASKQNTISDNGLSISKISNLQEALNGKHPLLTAQAPLSQSLVDNLSNSLALKQDQLQDVPGTGVSLLLGADRLRKIYGHGGIVASHVFDLSEPDAVTNYQIRISAEALQTALANVQQKTGAMSTDAFVSNPDLSTYIAGTVRIRTLLINHALLSSLIVASSENVDLAVRNWGNNGGFSVSNQDGKVVLATGLTLGGGGLAEVSTNSVRALTWTHDIGHNIVCGTVPVLSLSQTTGAYVTGGLGISGNCTIDGNLIVGSTNVLQALGAAQSSSQQVAVADVRDRKVEATARAAAKGESSAVFSSPSVIPEVMLCECESRHKHSPVLLPVVLLPLSLPSDWFLVHAISVAISSLIYVC